MRIYKWFDRKFTFDMTIDMYLPVVERLRGTPARVEELTRGLPKGVLTAREGGSWSIQEHVGHLLDLEPLGDGRLDDFEAGRDTLRAADLENRKTHEARHNENSIGRLLAEFRAAREALVARFDAYDDAFAARSALHPRLKQPMRVLDLAYFHAEHDDHHVARISQLKRAFLDRV
jgi:hypothetical protein